MFGIKKWLLDVLSEPEDAKFSKDEPLIPPEMFVPLPTWEDYDTSLERIRYNDLYHHGQLLNQIASGLNEHHYKAGVRFGQIDAKLAFLYAVFFTGISAAVGIAAQEVWTPIVRDLIGMVT